MFDGGLSVTAELNLGIARGGAGGGVFIHSEFDLYDPNRDGKVRVSEIIENVVDEFQFGEPLLAPLAVFDVSGEVTARLFAFFEVNLLFFSIYKEFNITPPITLVDFEIDFTRVPKLAREAADGVLQLSMGPFAEQRLNGDLRDGAEKFVVYQSGADHVKVWSPFFDLNGNGLDDGNEAQEYARPDRILVLGGEGDDLIDLSGITDSTITFEIDGGAGSDTIILGPLTGRALIRGGEGNDKITGGGGADEIYGDEGNDELRGGGGNDTIFGDDGTVTADAVSATVGVTDGNDRIFGGAGDDVLFGGGGDDTIEGGTGNDVIIGDGGVITLASGAVTESERGLLSGHDTLRGDAGDDLIYAGAGNDAVEGGEGDDEIYGEKGSTRCTATAAWTTFSAVARRTRSMAAPARTRSTAGWATTPSTGAMTTTRSTAAAAPIFFMAISARICSSATAARTSCAAASARTSCAAASARTC